MNKKRVLPLAAWTLMCGLFVWGSANESAAQQTPPKLSLTKTADSSPRSAGEQIGFTITLSNGASGGSATGMTLTDTLPPGNGFNWSLASGPANCSITGQAPQQTLTCSSFGLSPGASLSPAIHVISNTNITGASCGTHNNTVSIMGGNAPSLNASASVTVLCPSLTLTKTADAPTVSLGSPIGFTITVTNSNAAGTGTAIPGTRIIDVLPDNTGFSWSLSPPAGGCGVYNAQLNGGTEQFLQCDFPAPLTPGQSVWAHVVTQSSAATPKQCADYENTAVLTHFASPRLTAHARTAIRCPGSPVLTSPNGVIFAASESKSFFVTATGTPTPTYQVSGLLPTGIFFDGMTGELHGTADPASVGLWNLTFTARNGVPPDATQNFALFVGNPPCSLDVDDNNLVHALTDGLLLIRAMFGLTGTAVTEGALGGNAKRTNWTDIRNFLNGRCGTNFAQ